MDERLGAPGVAPQTTAPGGFQFSHMRRVHRASRPRVHASAGDPQLRRPNAVAGGGVDVPTFGEVIEDGLVEYSVTVNVGKELVGGASALMICP
jgi:hypothetical protein